MGGEREPAGMVSRHPAGPLGEIKMGVNSKSTRAEQPMLTTAPMSIVIDRKLLDLIERVERMSGALDVTLPFDDLSEDLHDAIDDTVTVLCAVSRYLVDIREDMHARERRV